MSTKHRAPPRSEAPSLSVILAAAAQAARLEENAALHREQVAACAAESPRVLAHKVEMAARKARRAERTTGYPFASWDGELLYHAATRKWLQAKPPRWYRSRYTPAALRSIRKDR